MRIERSSDAQAIKAQFEESYARMSDDASPAFAEWSPPFDPHMYYLTVSEGDEALGVVAFVPESNSTSYQVHVAFRRGARPDETLCGVSLSIAWMLAHTSAQHFFARLAEPDRPGIAAAKRNGFKPVGKFTRSLKRGGELLDEVVMEWVSPLQS